MTPLLDFLDRHPIATGTTGSALGIGSWIAEHLHFLSGLMADVGIISGGLLGFFTLCVWVENQVRTRLRNRQQRRRHSSEELFDELP